VTLPNFFVIGAARSGTTSLQDYLGQHPEIYMCPVKEPNFFAFDEKAPPIRGPGARQLVDSSVVARGAYEALFADAGDAKATGEISPRYLSTPEAPERIRREVPHARIIAVLRHPVDRAYASFVSHRRDGWEHHTSLRAAMDDEPRRFEEGSVIGLIYSEGCYHRHLERYYRLFERDRIRVHLFDDLVADPARLLADLFDFLEVDAAFAPDLSRRHNPSGEFRNPLLRILWKNSYMLRRETRRFIPRSLRDGAYAWILRDLEKPELTAELREELTARYREDILRLQDLIQRDLSHWLREPAAEGERASAVGPTDSHT